MENIACTTFFPPERPIKAIWLKQIARRELNLELVNTRISIGRFIVDGYRENPELTLKEITEMAKHNPKVMTEVMGPDNMKLIL